MPILREWLARLWGTLRRRRADADLEAELRSHLDLAADAGDATAPIGVTRAMEDLRDQRGLPWLDDFARDLRHAFRLLRRTPVFAGVAVLSLALGIGANSAIFSLTDALILRPLPVPDAGAIVSVSTDQPDEGFAGGYMSYPNYRDLRQEARSFDSLLAWSFTNVAFSRARDDAREIRLGMLVSENFFSTLVLPVRIGRAFTPDEARVPGRDAVVVLSDDFWRGQLNADPAIVGGVVWMNGIDFHVLGIAPPEFTGLEPPVRPAYYVPLAMAARLRQAAGDRLENRAALSFHVRGRLAPGVSRRRAQAELATIWQSLVRQYPEANLHRTIAVRTELETRLRSDPWDAIAMTMLGALSALVLLIACANVASLLMGRARARTREIAIRLSLGVSRSRLLRQLLTESLLLAALGCAAGLGLAYWGIRFLKTIPVNDQVVIDPQLDVRAVVFGAVAALVSAALFGLGPARRSLTTDLVPALKSSDAGDACRRRTTGRHTLVVAQIAISMVLLIATGMILDGFRKALALDPGFRTDHLITMSLDPSLVRYSSQQSRAFYRTLLERAAALPNVRSAALSSAVPFHVGEQEIDSIVPEGYQFPPGQASVPTFMAVVDEHYFDTMQIRLTRGRAFTAHDDATAPGVAIVNQEFANRFWPNQDPVGRRLRLPERRGGWLEVVGVTKTAKYTVIFEPPTPFVYLAYAQQERTRMSLLVESTERDPDALAPLLRDTVRALDVNQPIAHLRSFARLYEERTIAVPGMILQMVSTIGLLGLTLTLIGLYGLVAYSVERRTREIGIRMAIGAANADVLSMFLRQGMALSLVGIALGGLASIVAARLLAAALVGLGAPSPVIYVAVPLVLIALTAAATYVPARRAARVDPLVALRNE